MIFDTCSTFTAFPCVADTNGDGLEDQVVVPSSYLDLSTHKIVALDSERTTLRLDEERDNNEIVAKPFEGAVVNYGTSSWQLHNGVATPAATNDPDVTISVALSKAEKSKEQELHVSTPHAEIVFKSSTVRDAATGRHFIQQDINVAQVNGNGTLGNQDKSFHLRPVEPTNFEKATTRLSQAGQQARGAVVHFFSRR